MGEVAGWVPAPPEWARSVLERCTARPSRAGILLERSMTAPPPWGPDFPGPGMLPLVFTVHGPAEAGRAMPVRWLRLPAELAGLGAARVPGALEALVRRRAGWGIDPLPGWACQGVRGVVVVWEGEGALPAAPGRGGPGARGGRAAGTVRIGHGVLRPGFSDVMVRAGRRRTVSWAVPGPGGPGPAPGGVLAGAGGDGSRAAGLSRLLGLLGEVERGRAAGPARGLEYRARNGGRALWMTAPRRMALCAVAGAPGPLSVLQVRLETGLDRDSTGRALAALVRAGLVRGAVLAPGDGTGAGEQVFCRVHEPRWYGRSGLVPAWGGLSPEL